MAGENVNINGFRLDAPLTHPPKIYIGAQGPLMLRPAGEFGDGVIVNFITPETFAPMLDHIREGAPSGKYRGNRRRVPNICAVDEDEIVARTLFRRR